jgi:hypothetical protein
MSFYPCGLAAGKLVATREVRQLAGEQASDELFGLAPEEFVAARDALARRLKREGDAELAARVKALRRPTLSAWAVNQLARARGQELEPLLAAGERLRSAHQDALAGGGAAALRAAAQAEREAVTGLVGAALDLLRQAGHPTTDTTRDRIAATLHAAAADPAAAELVRHGRLTADLDPAGFGTVPEADDAEGEEEPGEDGGATRRRGAGTGPGRGGRGATPGRKDRPAARGRRGAAAGQDENDVAGQHRDKGAAAKDDAAAARARRGTAVAVRDAARKRARLAADQAVLATRQAERLGRLADQAEREAARARTSAAAAIEAASAARERATRAAKELREAEDRIPTDR